MARGLLVFTQTGKKMGLENNILSYIYTHLYSGNSKIHNIKGS